MVSYVKGPAYKVVKGINFSALKSYVPDLAIWGGVAGIAVLTFTENVPLFQETFLQKIPVFGQKWVKNVDPEDIPI